MTIPIYQFGSGSYTFRASDANCWDSRGNRIQMTERHVLVPADAVVDRQANRLRWLLNTQTRVSTAATVVALALSGTRGFAFES